ncbi:MULTISPECIES: hypothetical protein [Novosphingobium]|uniref:Uncharacterized protein n=1 Tax=Novosphingobium decolorationis TaxID=2698673 RepID=A0ABX8E096_9SPHN|nr:MULTISPECIES: hypothetical protein [Novosphingobium]MED5546620.1 hypothetical protein [Pseudomonadota bacterium]QVM82552.1 hypothetical protein HT578_01485 [Novosphingobium decolorationis]GAM06858.1 hypothetical protein MBENS4_3854 [Novosphingobium sp. MBES04]
MNKTTLTLLASLFAVSGLAPLAVAAEPDHHEEGHKDEGHHEEADKGDHHEEGHHEGEKGEHHEEPKPHF